MCNDYDNLYKQLSTNKKFKESVYKKLSPDIGVGCDDDELFEMLVNDVFFDIFTYRNTLQEFIPSDLSNKEVEFDKIQTEYWDEVHSFTDELANKYTNQLMDDFVNRNFYKDNGKEIVASALREEIGTGPMAHLWRHYNDIIGDIDSKYDLENSFTEKEYEQWYAKNKDSIPN